jgi:acetylornithine/N-succinyldiaminopimelate aminotransferase
MHLCQGHSQRLPFGGILAGEKCADVLSAGTHATTFGGNPICAAAALTVLETLNPEFLTKLS